MDQPRILECLDVLRGCRERHIEWLGKLTDRSLSLGQLAQHPSARGIAKGVEDGVEMDGAMFNHKVEYERARDDCQLVG
jgi:hypothetical protein